MATSGLLAGPGGPGAPVLPGGGGEGEGGAGEHLLEGGQGLDLLPDLLGPGLARGGVGVLGPPDGDLAILVDGELGEEALLPGQPHLVEQLGLALGELEGDVHPVLTEVLVLPADQLAADHAGGEGLPPAALGHVAHPHDVGAGLGELVAGDDVGAGDDGGAGVALEAPAAHLGQSLPAPVLVFLFEVRSMDLKVALHASLPRLLRLLHGLVGHLPQVQVLLLHLLQLLLLLGELHLELLGFLLHLGGDGVVQVFSDLLSRVLDLHLDLLELGVLLDEELLEEVQGDAVLLQEDLEAPGDLGDDANLRAMVTPLGLGLRHLLLVLPLPEVDVEGGELLLEGVEDVEEGGGGGDLPKASVEVPVSIKLLLLQLLPQGDGFSLEKDVVSDQALDMFNYSSHDCGTGGC